MKSVLSLSRHAVAALCAVTLAGCAPDEWHGPEPVRKHAWSPEILSLAAKLPVQSAGRIKPLDTYASYLLLRMNQKRMAYGPDPAGAVKPVRLKPTAWLLDCLFYPEQAEHYRNFRIVNSEVLDAVGLSGIVRKKADYYSFAELRSGSDKLYELANQYGRMEAMDRTPVQEEIVALRHNYHEFGMLSYFLEFARRKFPASGSQGLAKTFGGADEVRFSAMLAKAPALERVLQLLTKGGADEIDPKTLEQERQALQGSMTEWKRYGGAAEALAMLPPGADAPSDAEWLSIGGVTMGVVRGSVPAERYLRPIGALEEMVAQRDDPTAFAAALGDLHGAVRTAAEARGEYAKIELEVAYYKADLMFYAQWLFVLGFFVVALSWLAPKSKLLRRGSALGVVVPAGVLIAGITMRCILRDRPPISTLYETMLFVTAVIALVTLLLEWIHRNNVSITVGSLAAVAGMFLASRYELSQGIDTMPRLVAVLDTNFWLATHVTAVTTGYAGGMLAGFIAHVYVLGKLLGFRRGDQAFYKGLGRIVYGVLCFSLFFALVGTILGGIWANYSWGRFWGWDPKENGALMICLWQIAILHGRLAGYLRGLGICIAAILGNCVIAFSWFHVNMLGVGLHAYGKAEGMTALVTFYGGELTVAMLGGLVYMLGRARAEGIGSAAP